MKKDYSHITIVLDRSGSMAQVSRDTIGGFNTFLADQKSAPGTATITLNQFDDIFENVIDGQDIKSAKELNDKTFVPRGNTALLDAVGRSIEETGKWLGDKPDDQKPEKVIFVVITDGHENASKDYDNRKVADMIAHQRDKYSWEFVFIGANQDAFDTAQQMNIPAANTINYAANAVGTAAAYADASSNLRSFRTGQVKSMSWSAKQREAQKKAGAKTT